MALRGPDTDIQVRRFTLLVTTGPDSGQRFVSTGERMIIGTHPSCDVVLHDPTVSRFHCEITVDTQAIVVRDLDTTNRTLVDHQAVLAAYLRGGAVLALGHSHLRFETSGEPVRLPLAGGDRFGPLVGASVVMRRLFAELGRAAGPDAAVALEGERGSGKAAAARALHAARGAGPFVVVDCQGAPEGLEAELLGEAGAFALARGGTLYLREVADVPLALHPRLAAAIDASRGRVKVVAGSRRSLRIEVNARRLRSDLYQRIAAFALRLPPLRERPDDVPLLIEDLLARSGAAGPGVERLRTAAVLDDLARRSWSRNVAELAELVAGATGVPAVSDVPFSALESAWTQAVDRVVVLRALSAHPGDLPAAARALGLDVLRLTVLLERLRLRRDDQDVG